MRETSGASPFAAQTRQERQARWLLWQQKSVEAFAVQDAAPMADAGHTYSGEPSAPSVPAIRRPRYDAVVQRMQNAKRQTGAYSSWG